MVIAILADERSKKVIEERQRGVEVTIVWADGIRSLGIIEADIYIDLLFEFDPQRIAALKKLLPAPVIVNAVIHTTKDIGAPFIRFNAWPTMLEREIAEVATPTETHGDELNQIFDALGWKVQQVPDITGMATPRLAAAVINEAWHSFGDNAATKDAIETLVCSQTMIRYGPFELTELIGREKIVLLLKELQRNDSRYTIAPGLMKSISNNAADS